MQTYGSYKKCHLLALEWLHEPSFDINKVVIQWNIKNCEYDRVIVIKIRKNTNKFGYSTQYEILKTSKLSNIKNMHQKFSQTSKLKYIPDLVSQ